MSQVQVIETDGKPAFYVVPADIWLRVREMVQDAEDAAAYTEAVAQDDGFRVPLSVVEAKLGGASPLRAWREHRQGHPEPVILRHRLGVGRRVLGVLHHLPHAQPDVGRHHIKSGLAVGFDHLNSAHSYTSARDPILSI